MTNRLAAVCLAAITLVVAPTTWAQSDQPVTISIEESQPLSDALQSFADQTDLQVIFFADITDGKDAPALEGEFTADAALDMLLAETGLSYTFIDDTAVSVQASATSKRGASDSKNLTPTPVLMAQNQTNPTQTTSRTSDDGDEEQVQALENIIVTGSRIRGAQSASPIFTIDRAEIERSGFATVEDIVENLPQNFSAGATSDALNGTNVLNTLGGQVEPFGGGTSVNLRGLGASSTLVLVNGRRLSPGGAAAAFTNIASIPVTAIERVDVMTDGASAIYGSDAIAGVINFVLRSDYEGAETRLRYGSDRNGDTSDVQFGQLFGKSWNSGNVLFSYEFYERNPLAAADREFAASSDLSPFGGTDNRDRRGGNPANILAGGQIFAIPAGQDGRSLTAADFDPTVPPNLYDGNEFSDLMGHVERHSATLYLNQDVGSVNLFGSARFSTEDNTNRGPSSFNDLLSIPVTQDSPFFVDPTGTGLTEVTVERYSIAHDFGPRVNHRENETFGATAGAGLKLGNDWFIELVGNWAREEGENFDSNIIDTAAVRAAANNPDPERAFNPFGDGSNTNPDLLSSFVGEDLSSGNHRNELWSISLNADGDLFEGPGGAVKLAAGLDYRNEEYSLEADQFQLTTDLSRTVYAAYGELFIPLVGKSNARNGLQRLELSLAARFEDYDDFGNTTNPKLGVLWSPSESLTLRGTYGTSYRAPSLRDLDSSPSSRNLSRYFPAFLNGFPILSLNGSNENLQPEEAVTWTAGFQWRPDRLNGLSIDLTYFNIDFEDRISTPVRLLVDAINDPSLASLITVNPSIEEITAIANDPRYVVDSPFWPFNVPPEDLISGAVPIGTVVFARSVNSAQLVSTGAQLQLAYSVDTQVGVFDFNLNADYLFDFERRIIDADALLEEVDTIGRPVDFRARGGVNWSQGNWVVSGFVNYTDGYTDNLSDPARSVDSWTTVDLTVAYQRGEGAGILSDTRFALTTRNLLDEDPPFVDTRGETGYDAALASPLGQYFALQITKDW